MHASGSKGNPVSSCSESRGQPNGSRLEQPLALFLWLGPAEIVFCSPACPVFWWEGGRLLFFHDIQLLSQLYHNASSRRTLCVPTTGPTFFPMYLFTPLTFFVCAPNLPHSLHYAGRLSYQPPEVITGSFVFFFFFWDCTDYRNRKALFLVFWQGDAAKQANAEPYLIFLPFR